MNHDYRKKEGGGGGKNGFMGFGSNEKQDVIWTHFEFFQNDFREE